MGFKGKTLQYLEQSVAHWVMSKDVLIFMIPSIVSGGLVEKSDIRVTNYVAELDGLVLQGGSDVNPKQYGEESLRPEWDGDPARDSYEIKLVKKFVSSGKPILGICRGAQLINVAFGGTLYQDVASQIPNTLPHHHVDNYDQHYHKILIEPDSHLSKLYPGIRTARVNSIHHQAVKGVGEGLMVEARSDPDGIIEAIRWNGPSYLFGVQWHPEFHDPSDVNLLDSAPILDEFLSAARSVRGRG